MQTNEYVADRFGAAGATLMAVGIVLSGPIGLGVVTLTHPAAPWTSAEAYAHQFHWVISKRTSILSLIKRANILLTYLWLKLRFRKALLENSMQQVETKSS